MNMNMSITPQATEWENDATRWVQTHISAELLDAWLFDPHGGVRPFDDVWSDLKRARMMADCVDAEDLHHALLDLYCACYRWHLACANPALPPKMRHRQAMIAAVAEVWATDASERRRRPAETAAADMPPVRQASAS